MSVIKKGTLGILAFSVLLPLVAWTGFVAQEPELEWPRAINVPEGRVVLYQPQPDSFEGDRIGARFATSVTLTGAQEPVFGVVWVDARVETDRDARTVTVVG